MQFDDQNVDVSGVDDRRGRGGGVAMAGGGGILAVIVTIIALVLGGGQGGGIDLNSLAPGAVQGGTEGETTEQLRQRCNADGALDQFNDCYLIKVYNETDEVWSAEFARLGRPYQRPTLTFFSGGVQTGCGAASSQVGPFYCPPDQHMYIDIDFLAQLQQQFGAGGRYAQAYILAHEFGHHLQTLLGIEPQVRRLQQSNPRQRNDLSVRMELQADCLAGVWGRLANDRGNVAITEKEVREAQRAAAAVGDDRIQETTTGRVDPESWTHGSAQDREQWFTTGFSTGDIERCDTFG